MNNLHTFRKSIGLFRTLLYTNSLLQQPCILCGAFSASLCCAACEAELPVCNGVRCQRCALPMQAQKCTNCFRHPVAFDTTLAKFDFNYPLDHLVHTLKYQGHIAVATWFASQLAPLAADIHQRRPIDGIIAMPLHPKRLAERGFNQSHEIAKRIGRKLDLPCTQKWVSRRYHLRPQVELSSQARRQQPDDLFEAHADLDGAHILLIDDVMTTGTSLNNLARTLKTYGAKSVSCLVVARAHLPTDLNK